MINHDMIFTGTFKVQVFTRELQKSSMSQTCGVIRQIRATAVKTGDFCLASCRSGKGSNATLDQCMLKRKKLLANSTQD